MTLSFVESRRFGRVCYGYERDAKGMISLNEKESEIVKMIFNLSKTGNSLEKIQKILLEKQISSPSGNTQWTRAGIDKILNNGKYVPYIILFEDFFVTHYAKAYRCRYDQSM